MMILVCISSLIFLEILDNRLEKVLMPFLDTEVERFTTNLVNKTLNELDMNQEYNSLLVVEKSENGEIERFSYNTFIMNKISSEFSMAIQDKLIQLEKGESVNDFFSSEINNNFHHIKNGFLCGVSFSSLRNSHLFSNVGPVIPIRLLFLGQVMPDIDIKVKEYGINTMMVEIYFVARVKEQISMPFVSKKKEIVVNQLLTVDILKGEIPNYYNKFSK